MTEQQQAAMRQALEALELSNVNHWWGSSSIEAAITALRQALEQQPSAQVKVWDAEGYDALMQQMEMVKADNQRLSALVRAQQITIEKLEQQPADELVAWKPDRSGKYLTAVYKDVIPGEDVREICDHPKCVAMSWSNALADVDALKNRPQPAAIQQGWDVDTLLSKPKQQPAAWVGLTDEEINACDPQEECWGLHDVYRAIEAKLRSKNGGAA